MTKKKMLNVLKSFFKYFFIIVLKNEILILAHIDTNKRESVKNVFIIIISNTGCIWCLKTFNKI